MCAVHSAVLNLLCLLIVGLILAVVLMIWMTIHALIAPARRTYASALARGKPGDPSEIKPEDGGPLEFDAWSISSRGRELPVWEIHGRKADGPVFVFSHGWGDSRVGALTRVAPLAPLASRLIAWDMPGHGDAPGRCELGAAEADDLVNLVSKIGPDPRGVVLYGWSLGAGVSIAAAVSRPTGVLGVIAESPYRLPQTPARNVLRVFGLPHAINLPVALWLIGLMNRQGPTWRGFDRAGLASSMNLPLLVLHGEDDEISPVADGRAIAAAAQKGHCEVLTDVGHHGIWTSQPHADRCLRAVSRFLDEVSIGSKNERNHEDQESLPRSVGSVE